MLSLQYSAPFHNLVGVIDSNFVMFFLKISENILCVPDIGSLRSQLNLSRVERLINILFLQHSAISLG